jgi:hypothetical protein
MLKEMEGRTAPRKRMVEYGGRPRALERGNKTLDGMNGIEFDPGSLGGGEDGYAPGKAEKTERDEVGGARSV